MTLIGSTKPGPWTLSPQMTAAPELWRDAIVWPFWERSGITRAYGSESGLYGELNGSECFWSAGKNGVSVESVSGGTEPYININPSDPVKLPLGDNPLSITVAFEAASVATNRHASTLFALRGFDYNRNGYTFRIENSGELWFRTYGGNNGGTSAVVNLNQFHVATAVWNVGTGVKIFLDGEIIQNDTTLTDGNPSTETNPRASYGVDWSDSDSFGNTQKYSGKDTAFLGNFYIGVNHFRLLSDDEVKAFHADPFAMLRPREF